MDEEKKDQINETFRKVASNTAQDSKMRFLEGEQKYQESKEDGEFEQQSLIDKAGENYAFATEIALKGNIIYDDFRKNPRFNQTETKLVNINGKEIQCYGIGTSEWHESLSAEYSDARILNDPKEIKKLILENNPNDERRNLITSENRKNAEYKSLKFDDEKKVSGHSLYAYYQLQDGVAKNLINTEYYCYLEDKVKYTVYALLTEDILTTSNSGKTIMPKEMMEFLDTNKELAISLRYASISGKNISSKDFKFIREFSDSVVSACEYRFPLPKDYNQFDFEKYNYNNFKYKDIKIFNSLDEISKYKLQSCFSDEEIITMLNYVNILINAKLDISDINIFINNCIYFKHYVKNILKIKLKFTEKQYGRIDNFCKLIKAFQPFDENSKLLRDNEAFDSEEKIDYWKEKVEEEQELAKEEYDYKIEVDPVEEARYGHYRNLSDDQLKMTLEELNEDCEDFKEIFENSINAYEKTEAWNDFKDATSKMLYIEKIMNERNNNRKKH